MQRGGWGGGEEVSHSAPSYLLLLRVNTAEAFKEVNDLCVELKLFFWVLWVAAGEHRTVDREGEKPMF